MCSTVEHIPSLEAGTKVTVLLLITENSPGIEYVHVCNKQAILLKKPPAPKYWRAGAAGPN